MQKYNHQKIEKKWQKYWEAHKTFETKDSARKPKKYILDMFPYPSGAGLHVGHPEGYTATDILSRYRRMKGDNVLHPMGWDAFGLPAENYAIKEGIHPDKTTQKNIKRFREQIKSIGLSYDWSREVDTSSPEYYKWTQWLFLQLYKKGLAYKKLASVNWCPKDNTVLANEQVVDGKCERCGTLVVKKNLSQWFFKITDYAEELLTDLDKLDWPEPIKTMQRNWIGKSAGVSWKQKIKDLNIPVECYDSVPQTFMAQTFCVIAPEHALVPKLVAGTEHENPVKEFLDALAKRRAADRFKVENEIEGVFTGRYIENPFGTGDLPIWIASFVVADYGTGIVNCSAHDERDFAFAKKFNIPLRPVMFPADPVEAERVRNLEYCYHHDPEAILEQPVEFKGRKWGEARADIIDFVEKTGIGRRTVNYKLRDWLLSRQRYWGAPIPIIYCENCAANSKIKRFVILHGRAETSKESFIPWLKQNLEKAGYEVQTPDLPGTEMPNDLEQAEYVRKNCVLDESTCVVAHSFGGVVTMRLLEQRVRLGKVIFVETPVSGKFVDGKDRPSVTAALKKGFDFDQIKQQAASFVILTGKKQTIVPLNDGKVLAKKLNGELVLGAFKKLHFTGKQEPAVLNLALPKHRAESGMVPVPEKDLPVKLPTDVDFRPTGESPLKRSKSFKKVKCPVCGGKAERDYDTMDTFVDSSWYFLRYSDPKNKKQFADKKKMQTWLPVDVYVGGAEHAVLHLLYSRFFTKALRDFGYLNFGEPFLKLRNQGLILGPDGEKMSKSRGNVINPDDMVKEFGADSLRMYEMFMGPLEDAKPWQTQGVVGIRRFLDRVWNWVNERSAPNLLGSSKTADKSARYTDSDDVKRRLHKLTKKITEDIENFSFNTAVSSFMEFHNQIKDEEVSLETVKTFLKLLYPFAPHVCEELNQVVDKTLGRANRQQSLQLEPWPIFDPAMVIDSTVEIVVQVNGKVKGRVSMPVNSTEEKVMAEVNKKNIMVIQNPKRVVFVLNRLINFVV